MGTGYLATLFQRCARPGVLPVMLPGYGLSVLGSGPGGRNLTGSGYLRINEIPRDYERSGGLSYSVGSREIYRLHNRIGLQNAYSAG